MLFAPLVLSCWFCSFGVYIALVNAPRSVYDGPTLLTYEASGRALQTPRSGSADNNDWFRSFRWLSVKAVEGAPSL